MIICSKWCVHTSALFFQKQVNAVEDDDDDDDGDDNWDDVDSEKQQ